VTIATAGEARRAAFIQQLLSTYGADLRNYARRLCGGDTDRADDLVQETLLRAWTHDTPTSTRPRGIRSWLMTIARNTAIDMSRARWARPDETGPAALGRASVASAEDRILDTAVVSQAVALLSPEHRDVIFQVYYLGATVAETGDALGIPPGTVKSRAHYARRHLREILIHQGISWP
jgi:RNA polymerase sigma-70 factor (ECF subfamily)